MSPDDPACSHLAARFSQPYAIYDVRREYYTLYYTIILLQLSLKMPYSVYEKMHGIIHLISS